MANDMRVATCGDCIHANACARVPYFTEFDRKNPAYCNLFVNKADHEKVVRCGKCKWYAAEYRVCEFWHGTRYPSHYCAEGKVKDNELV